MIEKALRMSQSSTAAATVAGAIVISTQQPTSPPAAAAAAEWHLLLSRPRLGVSACSGDYWRHGWQTEISAGQLHADHIYYLRYVAFLWQLVLLL